MRTLLLEWLVRLATTNRWVIIIVTITLTVVSIALASHLGMDTRWTAMLPESMPEVREFIKTSDNYVQPGDMVLVVSGPTDQALELAVDDVQKVVEDSLLCPELTSDAECLESGLMARYVYASSPSDWLVDNGFALVKPNDARRMGSQLQDPRLLPWLRHFNADLEAELADGDAIKNQEPQIVRSLDAVVGLVDALDATASGQPAGARRVVRDLTVGNPYNLSVDGKLALVMIGSVVNSTDATNTVRMDKSVEAVLEPYMAAHPDVQVERTGMTAIARDEMDSVGLQTGLISLGALVLVFVLLVWNFRGVSTPIIVLIPIVLGVIWSLGVYTVTLGSLNMMTAMIMVVLLGLGVDFSIHLASRFGEEIAEGLSVEDALRRSLSETGTAVITGAVTSAAAFFALMIAQTRGVAQFGFASGVGVLVTLVA
ncbi:MAG: putative RND superfamily exporter protein, partial [Kiritimatiellia bacterium]